MTDLALAKVPFVGYGEHEPAMRTYRKSGIRRALALGNRGPIRFEDDGSLAPDILSSYTRCGFYVFENLIERGELDDLKFAVANILERAPVSEGAEVDRHGRPGLGVGHRGRTFSWVTPLSDPRSGTKVAHGRYPIKMREPTPPE